MTTTTMTTSDSPPTTTSTDQPEGWAKPTSPLDVGPVLRLPTLKMAGAALLGAALVWGLGVLVVWALGLVGSSPVMTGAASAAAGAAAALWVGLLVLQPWRPRHLGRWPVAWLAGRGASFGSVIVVGVLIYFAAQPDPLTFWAVLAGAYFAGLLAEVVVYASHVRAFASRGSMAADPADVSAKQDA